MTLPELTDCDVILPGRAGPEAEQDCSNQFSPMFVADWTNLVFHHFRIDDRQLKKFVPFELDLFAGSAYISLVGFKTTRIYVSRVGEWACWLHRPLTHHSFLNVRTYVRHRGEAGVYFLKIFVDSRAAIPVARVSYGLPYEHGRLSLDHRFANQRLTGRVETQRGELEYRAQRCTRKGSQQCKPGSEAEFLSERYSAFTCRNRLRRMFRIAHAPWRLVELETKWGDRSLLLNAFPWFHAAHHRCSYWTAGTFNVRIGKPQWVRFGASVLAQVHSQN